jgi:nicotinate phosphoribosyltransferase
MSFDTEAEAFDAYARAMPNNAIFLVDTYDTLDGVRQAIVAGKWLRNHGHRMGGIRLDSGDLAALSIEARRMLDEAGFRDATIVGSGDLDEYAIADLKRRGATIAVWGVGTHLATGYDDPALGGIYKLSAIRDTAGDWSYRLKLSEEVEKISNPGILQVRRFQQGGRFQADVIYDQPNAPAGAWIVVDPATGNHETIAKNFAAEDLLEPVFRGGKCVYESPPLPEVRARSLQQLDGFAAGVKRLSSPEPYHVGLEKGLYELRAKLISQVRRDTVKQG